MIRSMTAFSRISGEQANAELTWELRSVNHRYLEVFIRLPEELRVLETKARELVSRRLGRGKVECNLRCSISSSDLGSMEVDQTQLQVLLGACGEVEKQAGEAQSPAVIDLLRWPGVIRENKTDASGIQAYALELLEQALNELVSTRDREGARINELLQTRLSGIDVQVGKARERLPEVQAAVRKKLETRIAELDAPVDSSRLEQELVFLAQKLDVDEELDRLGGHVSETRSVLERDEPVGRRLDFMMQEFNREANTLGSKSADQETTAIAVELKVLIEQMREQVQNVE